MGDCHRVPSPTPREPLAQRMRREPGHPGPEASCWHGHRQPPLTGSWKRMPRREGVRVVSGRAGPLPSPRPSLQDEPAGTSGCALRVPCCPRGLSFLPGRQSLSYHTALGGRFPRRRENWGGLTLLGPEEGALDTAHTRKLGGHNQGSLRQAAVRGQQEEGSLAWGPSGPLWPRKHWGCNSSVPSCEGLPEFPQVFTQQWQSGGSFPGGSSQHQPPPSSRRSTAWDAACKCGIRRLAQPPVGNLSSEPGAGWPGIFRKVRLRLLPVPCKV